MPGGVGISPCLWFDDQAQEAARYYVGIFEDARINEVSRYTDAGQDVHGRPPGSVHSGQTPLHMSSATPAAQLALAAPSRAASAA